MYETTSPSSTASTPSNLAASGSTAITLRFFAASSTACTFSIAQSVLCTTLRMDLPCKNVLTELSWCHQPPAEEGPRLQVERYSCFSNTDTPPRVRLSISPGSPRLTTTNSACLR